jgi:hypothetical protein
MEDNNEKVSTESATPIYKLSDISSIFELLKHDSDFINHKLTELLIKEINDSGILQEDDDIFFLYDSYDSISEYHLNALYKELPKDKSKNLILFIHSDGGYVEPAYMISKSFNKLKKTKFSVVVPRKAISISQLGPIDPQLKGFPALGLVNALERITELIKKYPDSSDMFSKYISNVLDIRDLGYFERLNESAVQYAERLLVSKTFPNKKTGKELAEHFVNHYKAHGFVIDVDESKGLLGESIIKENSNYYTIGDKLFQNLDMLEFFFRFIKKQKFKFIGSKNSGFTTMPIEDDN